MRGVTGSLLRPVDLPLDVFHFIFSFMSPSELRHCRYTCSSFYKILSATLPSHELPWLEQRLRYAFIAAHHAHLHHRELWERLYHNCECFSKDRQLLAMWEAGRHRTNKGQFTEMDKIRVILAILKGIGEITERNKFSHCEDLEVLNGEARELIEHLENEGLKVRLIHVMRD